MPVQLPIAPKGPTPLPAAPHDPPTHTDIANAITYNRRIQVSYNQGVCTKGDLERAAIYQASVIAANDVIAPAWFAPAVTAAVTAAMEPALAPIQARLAELKSFAYTSYNLQCGDGQVRPFEIIPFQNGNIPTDPPHNLPGLRNSDDIIALTGPQATAYLNGYNVPVPHTLLARRYAIRIHTIGCAAP